MKLMFYKNSVVPYEQKILFKEKYHAEFSLALYEKIQFRPDSKLVIFIDNSTGKKEPFYSAVSVIKPGKSKPVFIDSLGDNLMQSFNEDILKKYSQGKIQAVNLTSSPDLDIMKRVFPQFDDLKYNEFKSILSNFNELVEEGLLKDKNNSSLKYKIIENFKTNDGLLISDVLIAYQDKQPVGYLSVLYTNINVASKVLGKDFAFLQNKNIDSKAFHRLLNAYDLKLDEFNAEYLKEETIKKLKKDFDDFRRENKFFLTSGVIDDVFISPDFRRKGIASEMYLKMAEHLDEKGLKLSSSTLRTDETIKLWDKLLNNHPYQVSVSEEKGREIYSLTSHKNKKVMTLKAFG